MIINLAVLIQNGSHTMNRKSENMRTEQIKTQHIKHLYFPLTQLSKFESIFHDADKGIFKKEFKPIMLPVIGKQLAVNTYYQNDLIAAANTRISIKLLKIFDKYKINFKVNKNDVTDEERDHALDMAMTQMVESKRNFLNNLKTENIPVMQSNVNDFITRTISKNNIQIFQQHNDKIKGYLEYANSAITSKNKYIATASALKTVMEKERRIFGLKNDQTGETIEHIIKTAWISLLIAHHLDDFDESSYKRLSIICMGHDGGKALIPDDVIYKKGRLTQLETSIMKTHVLLSYILASNNQLNLGLESFSMALHHMKEDKKSPLSYGIAEDTYTSYYQYLTHEAQKKFNKVYPDTKNYYRIIGIADTFEALTAERVYKKASSIGKTLEIMIASNLNEVCFYQPYLDKFVQFIIQIFLPKNLRFKITDELIEEYYKENQFHATEKNFYKKSHGGVILNSCSNFSQHLECGIFNTHTQKMERTIEIDPMFFLHKTYLK
jgi:HD-GYP domain-containing protein (c-di-GMP phosphodiesterase class II)